MRQIRSVWVQIGNPGSTFPIEPCLNNIQQFAFIKSAPVFKNTTVSVNKNLTQNKKIKEKLKKLEKIFFKKTHITQKNSKTTKKSKTSLSVVCCRVVVVCVLLCRCCCVLLWSWSWCVCAWHAEPPCVFSRVVCLRLCVCAFCMLLVWNVCVCWCVLVCVGVGVCVGVVCLLCVGHVDLSPLPPSLCVRSCLDRQWIHVLRLQFWKNFTHFLREGSTQILKSTLRPAPLVIWRSMHSSSIAEQLHLEIWQTFSAVSRLR